LADFVSGQSWDRSCLSHSGKDASKLNDVSTRDVNAGGNELFPVVPNLFQGIDGNIKMAILVLQAHVRKIHQASVGSTFGDCFVEGASIMEGKTKPLCRKPVLSRYGNLEQFNKRLDFAFRWYLLWSSACARRWRRLRRLCWSRGRLACGGFRWWLRRTFCWSPCCWS